MVILSIGRAVEKKGLDDLMAALALLPADLAWRLLHIGGGPLLPSLKAQAQTLGIAARIDWRGAQGQAEVLAALRGADLFALASRVARDGDRDGLPNVLMEAASQRLATLATRAGAIEELVEDGRTGLLVPAGDPPAFGSASPTDHRSGTPGPARGGRADPDRCRFRRRAGDPPPRPALRPRP